MSAREDFLPEAQDHQDGIFSGVTDVVEKVGGQAPQSLWQFVRANRAKFVARKREEA